MDSSSSLPNLFSFGSFSILFWTMNALSFLLPMCHGEWKSKPNQQPFFRALDTKRPIKPVLNGIPKLVSQNIGVLRFFLNPNVSADKILVYSHSLIPPFDVTCSRVPMRLLFHGFPPRLRPPFRSLFSPQQPPQLPPPRLCRRKSALL